jgi:hypothetical protein
MTQQHPITPPPELRRLWAQQAQRINPRDPGEWTQWVSEKAAQWGADQELEACCEWLRKELYALAADGICAARRPKPPNLKDQALDDLHIAFDRGCLSEGQADTIRRALEQLPDNE